MLVVIFKVLETLHVFGLDEAGRVDLVDGALLRLLREFEKDINSEELDEEITEGELHEAKIVGLHPLLILGLDFLKVPDQVQGADVAARVVQLGCRLVVPKRPVEGRGHVQEKEDTVDQK